MNFFLVLLSLLLPGFLYAENILEIYLLATENDPVVLGARQSHLANAQELVVARSKFLPNVSFSGDQNYNKASDPVIGHYNAHVFALSINQPIFHAADWMSYATTDKQVLASLKNYENTEQQLILRVAQQYFVILEAWDQLQSSIAKAIAAARQLEQAKQQFKVGVNAITDVNDAQARLDAANATKIANANSFAIEKENMAQIIGKVIKDVWFLKKGMKLSSPKPDNVDDWLDKSRNSNLQVQAAKYSFEAARAAIKNSSANHLPTLDLNGNVANNKVPPPGPNKYYNKQLSINLNMPIFSGGSVVAQTQAAIFQADAAFQQLETAYRTAEISTKNSYRSVLTYIAQVAALAQSVKSSKLALDATKAAFKVGTRTIVDVLNAQSDLLNAETSYAKAHYDYLLESLKLKQATGSLNISDLEQVNNWLESPNASDPDVSPGCSKELCEPDGDQ